MSASSHGHTIRPHSGNAPGPHPNIPPRGPTRFPSTAQPNFDVRGPMSFPQTTPQNFDLRGPTRFPSTAHPNLDFRGPMSFPQTTPQNFDLREPSRLPATAHQHHVPTGPVSFPQTTPQNFDLREPSRFPATAHQHHVPTGPVSFPQTTPTNFDFREPISFPATTHQHHVPTAPMSFPQTTPKNFDFREPISFPATTHQHHVPTGPMNLSPTAPQNIAPKEPTSLLVTVPATTGPVSLPASRETNVPTISPLNYRFPSYQDMTIPLGQSYILTPVSSKQITGQAPSYYIQPYSPPREEGADKIGIRERPKSSVKWMSETHLPLKHLPILGTNNSGSSMGQHRAQCVDISEQLELGVRLLDLAIVQYHDEIYVDQYKHIYDLLCPYITISEALLSIKFFLERYPSEVLYLNLRCRSDTEATHKDQEIGEGSDPIDSDLLEAKFDVIKKFFFDIGEINLDYNAKKLTASKKNIICFAKDLPCFNFLLENRLSLYERQLIIIIINEYNISTLLEEHWTQQKADASVTNPHEKRFSWFIIDAVTPARDATVLKEKWELFNKAGNQVPFHFFSLCKVTQNTWIDFRNLILAKHPQ